MIVLADNDIVRKLACCDLFEEFHAAHGTAHADIQILATMKFAMKRKFVQDMDAAAQARLQAFLQSAATVSAVPDPQAVAALTEHVDKNIDAGEAVLFATCPMIPGSMIVTGDKKSLTGLAAAGAVDEVVALLCQKLEGRISCFEQIMMRIAAQFGFAAIRQKIIFGRECDGMLLHAVGSRLDATEENFTECMLSGLNTIRATSGKLLQA